MRKMRKAERERDAARAEAERLMEALRERPTRMAGRAEGADQENAKCRLRMTDDEAALYAAILAAAPKP